MDPNLKLQMKLSGVKTLHLGAFPVPFDSFFHEFSESTPPGGRNWKIDTPSRIGTKKHVFGTFGMQMLVRSIQGGADSENS